MNVLDLIVLTTTGIIMVSAALLGISVFQKSIIRVFVSMELMLLAIAIFFAIGSFHLDDAVGELFIFIMLSISAAEIALGLSILISYYNITGTDQIDELTKLFG